jgi:ABC-type dipeptide/oligopeptide/nickel transport system ATPase subunit
MSGEAVLISAMLTPAGLAVAGALAAGTIAAQLVNGWQEERRRRAEAKMREEKARIGAWQQFQLNQQDRMESLNRARNQVREHLAALSLNTLPASTPAKQPVTRPRGFLGRDSAPREALAKLSALERLFSRLPGELFEVPDAPLVRLREQVERLQRQFDSAQPPLAETIDDLQTLVDRTLNAQLEELERTSEAQKQLTEQGETLLEEVMAYTDLSTDTGSGGDMRALRENLLALLGRNTGRLSDLQVLGRKFAQLKERIDSELQQTAVRNGIGTRMQYHLEEMGYRHLSEEQTGHSNWQLPGGEQVRIALQRNLGIAFQLQHERGDTSDAELSEAEIAFFRQQEQHWCDDLAELTRRLTADGFQYRLQFERDLPESSVPIVVVEGVDELLEEEEEHWDGEKKRRRLT